VQSVENQSKIKLLPENIIDQIKAGEVIERPASLLKELIENALDAKSTKISISLRQNGLELIEISDNGEGMNFTDLPYAFLRHATSKISRFEDLYSLASFGFRGEALASAASVSKIRCVTQPQLGEGGKIEIEGAQTLLHIPNQSTEQGTTFYIKDLFFNTPARLKFIKSSTSEKNALEKVINGYLISNPQVEFHIKWDDKEKKIFPKVETTLDRIKKLYLPKELEENDTLEFHKQYNGIELNLILINSNKTKSSQKCQYIMANERQIQDKQIHSIITHFADGIHEGKQYSEYYCHIHVSPQALDVNVHPNKLFVKFHQSGELFSLVSATMKSLLPVHLHESGQTSLQMEKPKSNQYLENLKDLKIDQPQTPQSFHFKQYLCLGYFVIDDERIYNLKQTLKEFLFSKNSEILPLMISEPLDSKLKLPESLLRDLETYGFELDTLNQGQLILRGLPLNWQEINGRDQAKNFIFSLTKEKSLELAIDAFCENFDLKNVNTIVIENLINRAGLSNSQLLTKDLLKKL
jgi:DNA mismatch repair protein MutL